MIKNWINRVRRSVCYGEEIYSFKEVYVMVRRYKVLKKGMLWRGDI